MLFNYLSTESDNLPAPLCRILHAFPISHRSCDVPTLFPKRQSKCKTQFMMCVYSVNKTCHPGVYNYALDVNDQGNQNNDVNNTTRHPLLGRAGSISPREEKRERGGKRKMREAYQADQPTPRTKC